MGDSTACPTLGFWVEKHTWELSLSPLPAPSQKLSKTNTGLSGESWP